jgi:lipid-A-disaccharide synthase
MTKFFVITGEASGDLHASFLIKAIQKRIPESRFFGIGGERMKSEGVELFFSIENLSVIGFWEVVTKINKIRRILRYVVKKMKELKPDAIILVDSPGFNLRLAHFAKILGIKVYYYITPQLWAWGGWRLRSMYKYVDHALVIFHFEERIFSSYGIRTSFVGHPLIDEMKQTKSKEEFCLEHNLDMNKPIVALLPGSREGEIKRILPIMLKVSKSLEKKRNDIQFVLPTISEKINSKVPSESSVEIIYGETSDGINVADAAIAASGTVTLETAFLGTPSVIVYKLSILSYLIVKSLIKLPYIGLVNIVREKKIISEYVQFGINIEKISNEILRIIEDREYRSEIESELRVVKEILGSGGASENASRIISEDIIKEHQDEKKN